MLGRDAVYDDLPYFFTDQYDLGMEYVGHSAGYQRVVTRGDIRTLDIPLYAAESVQAGTLQSRALDALLDTPAVQARIAALVNARASLP